MLLLSAGVATATELPPMPNDAVLIDQALCVDNDTNEEGVCALVGSKEGLFLIFGQEGEVQWIRKLHEGKPYEQVYINDTYNTY